MRGFLKPKTLLSARCSSHETWGSLHACLYTLSASLVLGEHSDDKKDLKAKINSTRNCYAGYRMQ